MQLLNTKHEIFAQALVTKKCNLTSAYSLAYPKATYKSCRQLGSLLSRNVNIKRRLQELLQENGLGLTDCIKKLNKLSEATRIVRIRDVQYVQPVYGVQLEALRMAFRLHILIGDQKEIICD